MNKKEAIERIRSDYEKILSILESFEEPDGDFWESLAQGSSVSLELATKAEEQYRGSRLPSALC